MIWSKLGIQYFTNSFSLDADLSRIQVFYVAKQMGYWPRTFRSNLPPSSLAVVYSLTIENRGDTSLRKAGKPIILLFSVATHKTLTVNLEAAATWNLAGSFVITVCPPRIPICMLSRAWQLQKERKALPCRLFRGVKHRRFRFNKAPYVSSKYSLCLSQNYTQAKNWIRRAMQVYTFAFAQ
jgi:hypothetical protein